MSDADQQQNSDADALENLAREYLDLWQDHTALTASDPKIAEQWQQMFRQMANGQHGGSGHKADNT